MDNLLGVLPGPAVGRAGVEHHDMLCCCYITSIISAVVPSMHADVGDGVTVVAKSAPLWLTEVASLPRSILPSHLWKVVGDRRE